MATFSRIIPLLVTSFGLQTVFALYFVPRQVDKFYDLCGALGFLATTFASLYYPALRDRLWYGKHVPFPELSALAPRQMLLNAAIVIWSVRLGAYLAVRTYKTGGDSRFVEIKKHPGRFATYWIGQGSWNFIVGLPVYLVNFLPPKSCPALGPSDLVALAVLVSSLVFEVVADRQKQVWRASKDKGEHHEKFIASGLWSLSRHPNYVGEVGIWTGMYALAFSALRYPSFPPVTPALAFASPFFTYLVVRHLTGVPPLEKQARKRWGEDSDWKRYKTTVPVFWPWWRSYE